MLANLHDIPRETMLGAVAEFITELNQKKGGFKGGPKTVETFMENLFDADRVAQLFGKAPAVSTGEGSGKVWADMKAKPAADLTAFLSEQRPEVVSLILAELLDILTENDPENAKRIRDAMLTFEDLPARLPSSAIPILFKDMPVEKLQEALKAGSAQSPDTVEYLYANISQRMAGQFKEQVEELPDLSDKQADKAISGLMVFIGQLEKQGRVTLIKPAATEE